MPKVICPQCGQAMFIPADADDPSARCPCGQRVTLPAPAAFEATPTPAPTSFDPSAATAAPPHAAPGMNAAPPPASWSYANGAPWRNAPPVAFGPVRRKLLAFDFERQLDGGQALLFYLSWIAINLLLGGCVGMVLGFYWTLTDSMPENVFAAAAPIGVVIALTVTAALAVIILTKRKAWNRPGMVLLGGLAVVMAGLGGSFFGIIPLALLMRFPGQASGAGMSSGGNAGISLAALPSGAAAAWFAHVDGQSFGPMDEPTVRQAIAEGRIARATPVWRGGMANWIMAGDIAEWRPYFRY